MRLRKNKLYSSLKKTEEAVVKPLMLKVEIEKERSWKGLRGLEWLKEPEILGEGGYVQKDQNLYHY